MCRATAPRWALVVSLGVFVGRYPTGLTGLTGLTGPTGQTAAVQKLGASRIVLALVTDLGNRPLVNLGADDFAIDEGGQPRDILSLHVADYPIAVLLDDTAAAGTDMDTVRAAAARFISRIGERAVAVGTLTNPTTTVAAFEDTRATVLERITQVSVAAAAPPLPLQAAANAARLIRENGTPFSAIVIVSARPVSASQATDRQFLTPVLESGAIVYVIANRTPAAPGASPDQSTERDDVLQALAEQTHGQYVTIYSPSSYSIALDHLADRLAGEMMIEYLVPEGSPVGDVRVGVRIPGAKARGLGVSR